MKIAVPVAYGRLTDQFGQSSEFVLVAVENGRIAGMEIRVPPIESPGLLPRWLKENGVNVVISGGMGARAVRRLQQIGIDVHTGDPRHTPQELVRRYLDTAREWLTLPRDD
jgi:predicted Fe-Mo cluster-binding NifX family protein